MLDERLRPVKDRVARPVVGRIAPHVTPGALTVGALLVGLGAASASASGLVVASVVLWWASRLLDGLDGPVARARGASSDLGGYLDLLGDTVVYAAIPIGVAVSVDESAVWIATAVMLATFYVNLVSWMFLSALVERHGADRAAARRTTSIVMPPGWIEGTETMLAFTVLLAWPSRAAWWCGVFAALVAATAVQRVVWARRNLRPR